MGAAARRLPSIDLLRGFVMVLMALDHTRGMVSGTQIDPTNLAETSPLLFLTRWCTHFCAPIFVFLAGTSAFLLQARGRRKGEVSRFLWTRGVWLIFLEFTLVRMGWSFRLGSDFVVGQVIWALGWSMIGLAGLIYLPLPVVGVFGIALIGLHNLFDGVKPGSFGSLAWLWGILHGGYSFKLLPSLEFRPSYALAPWMGAMAAGYAFGAVAGLEPAIRGRRMLWLGIGLSAAFVVIRMINVYGDPAPWSGQRNFLFTCFSFVNCTKYPPSLLFLLMTLGPGIVLLGLFEAAGSSLSDAGDAKRGGVPIENRRDGRSKIYGTGEKLATALIVFGRVPMFYYLLHLPLIHLLAVMVSIPHYRIALGSFYYARPPASSGYGHELWVVYLVWVMAVLLLFPLCRWFGRVKQERSDFWLSYL